MKLNSADLRAIKRLIDESIDERLPVIIGQRVQPMLNHLEKRTLVKLDQLTLDVGQFSLETTSNFMMLNAHVDDLDDGLASVVDMTDNMLVEVKK